MRRNKRAIPRKSHGYKGVNLALRRVRRKPRSDSPDVAATAFIAGAADDMIFKFGERAVKSD